jgi:hypothetical protein
MQIDALDCISFDFLLVDAQVRLILSIFGIQSLKDSEDHE